MVAPLTAISKDLSELLAEFRASVEAAQQQQAASSWKSAKRSDQEAELNKAADTDAGPGPDTEKALQDLHARTEASAVAAAQHVVVVKQLIDLVSTLNRRSSASSDQVQQMSAQLQHLQTAAADLQSQMITSVDNQQDTATQISTVLDISKHLQTCVEELASELDTERAAKKRLEQQMDALQQQVLYQSEALSALQSAAEGAAEELNNLRQDSAHASDSIAALVHSKSQLHKQLQKMLRLEQQLDTDLRDTQLVVAGELSTLRKHIQTVNNRTVKSVKQQHAALSSSLNNRISDLASQLEVIRVSKPTAAAAGGGAGTAAAGSRRISRASSLANPKRGSKAAAAAPQQPQPQQQWQQPYIIPELLAEALLSDEPSAVESAGGYAITPAAAAAAEAAARSQFAAAADEQQSPAVAAAGDGSSSSSHKKKKGSKRPPWVFDVLEGPQQQQHDDNEQQQQQQELTFRPQATSKKPTGANYQQILNSRRLKHKGRSQQSKGTRNGSSSSSTAQVIKDRLVRQQQQQQRAANADKLSRHGLQLQAQLAGQRSHERWIP